MGPEPSAPHAARTIPVNLEVISNKIANGNAPMYVKAY